MDSNTKVVFISESDSGKLEFFKSCVRKLGDQFLIIEAQNGLSALQKISMIKVDLLMIESKFHSQLLEALPQLDPILRPTRIIVFSEKDKAQGDHNFSHIDYFNKNIPEHELTAYLKKSLLAVDPRVSLPKLDLNFFNTFVDGMKLVFNVSAGLEIKKKRLILRKVEPMIADMGACIPLKSTAFEGCMYILLQKNTFDSIAKNVFGDEMNTPDFQNFTKDFAGELANQVYGFAKRELNNFGYGFGMSIPQLLKPSECNLACPSVKQVFVNVPFTSKYGEVFLEIQIHKVLS